MNVREALIAPAETGFALSPHLNPQRFAQDYERAGRVHIPGFLAPDSAEHAHATLIAQRDWNLVTRLGGRHVDLDAAGMDALADTRRADFHEQVHNIARTGFQYLYAAFPIYDLAHRGLQTGHPLLALYRLLNSAAALSFFRAVTGDPTIGFVDAQATRFRPGDFLTAHDDAQEGKSRVAAYVLNLTRPWRPDWGGQLQFIREDGHVGEAYVPAFNALNILRVPQSHAVSVIAPFAAAERFAITGWLRRGADPGPVPRAPVPGAGAA